MNRISIEIAILAGSLLVILFSCEMFTNAIEWFGKKLKVGEGLVGSIFSAVGTCLPETLIPILAIFTGKGDIGLGAIAGAPFMLCTLALSITGLAVILYSLAKKRTLKMKINPQIISRDIGFFLIAYIIGILTSFSSSTKTKTIVAVSLCVLYLYYIYLTAKNDSNHSGELEALKLSRLFRVKARMDLILIQLILALGGIVAGAHFFVQALDEAAVMLNVHQMVLALILAPVATELPEKFNSIIWIGKKKDTLALGNITGAMVFQSCIPVAMGIQFTPWALSPDVLISATAAIISGLMNYIALIIRGKMSPYILLLSGVFYAAAIYDIFANLGK